MSGNSNIDLFAALDLTHRYGEPPAKPRERAIEFQKFLNVIDGSVPAGLKVHVVLDNSSTHKTPALHRWLLRHPRFEFLFTPTSLSWMNLVESWFAGITTSGSAAAHAS
jgi:DDE superfamily endonuclease